MNLPAATDSLRWLPIADGPVSPIGGRHDDVYFTDLSNGWIANTRGEIHRTLDGGTTLAPGQTAPFQLVVMSEPEEH